MCEWCSILFFLNRYCQYQSTTTEPGLNLWLERVESPGSRRTAVLQGRVESRCPSGYLEKKRGATLMTGYVAGDGGVTGISAHSSPTRQSNFRVDSRFPIHYYTRAPCENPINLDNDSCGCVVLARCFILGGEGGGGRKYLVHSRKYGKRTPNG